MVMQCLHEWEKNLLFAILAIKAKTKYVFFFLLCQIPIIFVPVFPVFLVFQWKTN